MKANEAVTQRGPPRICKPLPLDEKIRVLLIIGVRVRSHSGLRLIELVQKRADAKVIIMDLAPVQTELVQYVSAGVCGFVLKDATSMTF
jgi:ActR/RegA family two-component response regulator